jgi:hypothetical protein
MFLYGYYSAQKMANPKPEIKRECTIQARQTHTKKKNTGIVIYDYIFEVLGITMNIHSQTFVLMRKI